MHIKIKDSMTLFETLKILAPDSSHSKLRSWLQQGRVVVDQKVQKIGSTPLSIGQTVEIVQKEQILDQGLKIIFEDQHIVVVDKPSGLLSVASNDTKEPSVYGILKKHYSYRKVFVVHRIDQDTSGVLLFALTEEACEKLKEIFEKHSLERVYIAMCQGFPLEKKGTYQSLLFEDANYVVKTTKDPSKGKLAITHYEVLRKKKEYCFLKVTLETGRKNQIRVHFAEALHPIVGDRKYGAKINPLKRLGLHAATLSINHPITEKLMTFNSPCPFFTNRF
jgi:tRNA pseudouridine32 synthase/23S rRNA pseudouridine746 synthase/23S rRNA pseudouridine1911/1915/1917 synthase